VSETGTSIKLTVIAQTFAEPCTAQNMTLFGYVTPASPIEGRTIEGSVG
jgi:hypothetical protein